MTGEIATVRVGEPLARATRTAVQATPAWIITEMLDAFLVDMTERQYGVLVLFLTMVISWAQALIENRLGTGLLRAVPPKDSPVVG